MAGRDYFISKQYLNEWLDSGKAEMIDGTLSFRVDRQYQSMMFPAYYLKRCMSRPDDPAKLLGKVFEPAALKEVGVEVVGGSAVAGEAVYEIEEGFLLKESFGKPGDGSNEKAQVVIESSKEDVELLVSFVLSGMRSGR